MTRRHVKLARLTAFVCASAPLAGAAIASAQGQSQGADLAVTITASAKHARPDHAVFFTVTITNDGPASDTGLWFKLALRGGLANPRLRYAPPDTIKTICAGGSARPITGCTTHWVPPTCHDTGGALTCRYHYLELTAPSGPSDSISLLIRATTGKRRDERAKATAIGAHDPNPSNDRRVVNLQVGTKP